MRKKQTFLIVITFIIFIALNITKVSAVALTIKASKTTAKVGDIVTITVNGKGISGKVNLSVSGNGNLRIEENEEVKKVKKASLWVDNSNKSINLEIEGTGSVKVTATPDDISDSTTSEEITNIKSVSTTIKVNTATNNTNTSANSNTTTNNTTNTTSNTTTNTTTENSTAVSTDATLKNLGIKPNDFSGFKKATTNYSVSVPKDVDKVTIYATPSNAKATVTGTGVKNLQIGKNTFNIKVTAEDKKTTKTYTLTITREETTVSDATLTNLGIRPKEYDFTGFKPSTTTYNVSVPNDVEKITIYATAKNSKDVITGIGNKSLEVGANKCEIKVTSEDKKATKTYIINVTRKEDDDATENEDEKNDSKTSSSVEGLKNIEIKNYTISPSFSQDVFSYKAEINKSVDNLEISTETTSDNIEVEIVGNENLKQGENIITILVHNKKDDTTSTYQITANVVNEDINLTTVNNEIKKSRSSFRLKEWIIKGVMLLIVILIIIFLIKRHQINEEYDEDDAEEDEEDDEEEDDDIYDDEEDELELDNKNRKRDYRYKSTASEEIRNIGLFDDTQKIEYEDYEKPKRNGKYKGRRYK